MPARRCHLALGSNLGDREAFLTAAVDDLDASDQVDVVAVSAVYETDPVGGPEQGPYLNAVVALDTTLDARDLLALAHDLEARAGRVRTVTDGPRTLDVDVLTVGEERHESPDLVVPHPRMAVRGFVLAPLADVAPALVADLVEVPPRGWDGVRRTGIRLGSRHPQSGTR